MRRMPKIWSRSPIAVVLAIVVAQVAITPAAEPPKAAATAAAERVMILVATQVADAAEYIYVMPPEGGAVVKLLVGTDARRTTAMLFKHRGELVRVAVRTGTQGLETVTAVAPFDGPKGLRSPRAYVFDGVGEQKAGGPSFATVRLSRFGQVTEAAIPNRPVAGQKPGPDPVLLARVRSLTSGDVVEVDLQPASGKSLPTLLDLDVYGEPRLGEFVKLDIVKDGNKSLPAVTLLVDDRPETFAFPAAAGGPLGPTAAGVQPFARKLRPGIFVRFTARANGGHEALRDLRLDGEFRPEIKGHELITTYARVGFFPSTSELYVNIYPGSYRPEDELFIRGVRSALYKPGEAARLKISDASAVQLRLALRDASDSRAAEMTPQERQQWTKAYAAYVNARGEAERSRVEQQMLWAGQEVSARCRKEVDSRYTILRAAFDGPQLEAIRKLGIESAERYD